ncbi:peroxisomal membrane protein Pex14p [[Candida] jaroonii]|uniref:Peroxisomal membrane protein Pex14p n=1 Tax=[Candida] jaroonii TaxID=467808 RepID=A0ACA9Y376_9ASCO|nr:peroxisomal membrane protein Pex14p [[Candida] jaroonii]
MNEELLKSAVSFLKDPNVTSSPLNKKIEFLQSKGLNEEEIEEALNRANNQNQSVSSSQPNTQQVQANYPPIDYYNVAPPVPERSWKDYFIMATATVGVSYGIYQVVSKYLIPSIIPPSQSVIDEDKQKIDEEFLKIDKLLDQLSIEQKEIKQANDEKLTEIDTVINNVNDFLSKYNKDKLTFDDDLRLMKLEIDNLKNSVEKNLNLTKNNLKDDLSDINEELVSLKNLIKLRSSKETERKLAPVSSIPSASEILKKSKKPTSNGTSPNGSTQSTTASTPAPSTPVPASVQAEPVEEEKSTTSVESKEQGVRFSGITEPSSAGGVTAAGIPEWQMKHKLAEENKEKFVQESINKVGVPAWQLNQST